MFVLAYKCSGTSACNSLSSIVQPAFKHQPTCLVSLLTLCMQAPHANGFQQRTLADIILQKIQDKERAQGQASTSGYAPLHCIILSMHHCDQAQAKHCESRVYSSESRVNSCDLTYTELQRLECIVLVKEHTTDSAQGSAAMVESYLSKAEVPLMPWHALDH